ncbi:hypothetical protein [Chitinophaga sp. CC14]|uniref:hypothetical protein n=1 Tax=Chitinophaga sp. CC14 TaxID=3029199 RepID=UPI003B987A90
MRWRWKVPKNEKGKGQQEILYRWLDVLIQKYFPAIRKYTNLFSDRLNRLPKRYLKVIVLCFFGLGTCAFIYIGLSRDAPGNSLKIKPYSISRPANIISADPVYTPADLKNSTSYRSIVRFRYYLDSLRAVPNGEKTIDILYTRHPGIFDSLLLVDKTIGLP